MPKISEEKKRERREHILNVAFELFAEKGYSATGMRDIMKAANVSKGGIYVYFESKTEILLAIVKRFDHRRHNMLESADTTLPAEDIFAQYLRKRLEVFKCEENRKWSRISLAFWSLPKRIPELSSIMDRRFKAYKADIEYIIGQGIDKGVFRKDCLTDAIVYQIMSTINGTGVLSGAMGRVITDSQIEETIKMYLKYLKGE